MRNPGLTQERWGLARRAIGGGLDFVGRDDAPDEVARFWIEGEEFPRLVLDIQSATGGILIGDGTAPPLPIGGALGLAGLTGPPTFSIEHPLFGLDEDNAATAINTASLTVALIGGGTVYFPAGTYGIDGPVNVFNTVEFLGASRERTILALNDGVDDTVVILGRTPAQGGNTAPQQDIRVRRLTIDANRYGQDQDPANLAGCHGMETSVTSRRENILIEDVHVKWCGHYGIGIQGEGAVSDVHLNRVYIEHTGGDCFDVKGNYEIAKHNTITNSRFEGPGEVEPAQVAIDLRGCWQLSNVYIGRLANDVHPNNFGIRFRPTPGIGDDRQGRISAMYCTVDGASIGLAGAQANAQIVTTPDATDGSGEIAAIGCVVSGQTNRGGQVIFHDADSSLGPVTSFQTAEFTPTLQRLQLLAIHRTRAAGGGAPPTVTGNGLTWTQIEAAASGDASDRLWLFAALPNLSDFHHEDLEGQVTVDFGVLVDDCQYQLIEVDDISAFTQADAVIQTKNRTQAGTVNPQLLFDDAFGDATNYCVAFFAIDRQASDGVEAGVWCFQNTSAGIWRMYGLAHDGEPPLVTGNPTMEMTVGTAAEVLMVGVELRVVG